MRLQVAGDAGPLAPDWFCAVESSSTRRIDRGVKRDIYPREQVRWLWAVDPAARLLEVFVLDGERYALALTATEAARVRAVPFDAIELDLSTPLAAVDSQGERRQGRRCRASTSRKTEERAPWNR